MSGSASPANLNALIAAMLRHGNAAKEPRNSIFGTPPPANPTNAFSGLLGAVPPSTPPNAFGGLLRSAAIGSANSGGGSTRTISTPALMGLLGTRTDAGTAPPTVLPNLPPAQPQQRQRVFFSFYYDDDIRRACIVRKSWQFRKGPKLPLSSFIDNSLWENSRRENPESLKRLIREGMAHSTATCVLAGTNTWTRPWVRFEIAHSLFRRNGLFTVHIHGVRDPQHDRAPAGPNPLDYMGLVLRPDGRGEVWERTNYGWQPFELAKRPVPWPSWLTKPHAGYIMPLSTGAAAYDYAAEDGFQNLPGWAHTAAKAARR